MAEVHPDGQEDGPAVLDVGTDEQDLRPWPPGAGNQPASVAALAMATLSSMLNIVAIFGAFKAFVNARAADIYNLGVGFTALGGKVAALEGRLAVLEAKVAIAIGEAAPVAVPLRQVVKLECPIGPDPTTLSGHAAQAARLQHSAGMVKLNKDGGVSVPELLLLIISLNDYVARVKKLPYMWFSDHLDASVRDLMLGAQYALGLTLADKPTNALEWYNFVMLYIYKFGTPLEVSLKDLPSIFMSASETLTLAAIQAKLGVVCNTARRNIDGASEESIQNANARRHIVSALAKSVPAQVATRFYFLLGISPAEEPPVTKSFDDYVRCLNIAVEEIWNEASRTSSTSLIFKKADKADKPASAPAPAPAPSSRPANAGAGGSTPGRNASSAAARVAHKSATPASSSPKPNAGAGTGDSSPKFTCMNCEGAHSTSSCRKPCKNYKSGDAASCSYGRACVLGPVVPNLHGDERKKREDKPKTH